MGVATLRRRPAFANRPTMNSRLVQNASGSMRAGVRFFAVLAVLSTSLQWALTEQKTPTIAKVRPIAGPLAEVRRCPTQLLWHSETFPCRIVPTWSRPQASAQAPSITNLVSSCVSLIGSDRIPEANPRDILISGLFPSPIDPSPPSK